MQLAVSFFPGTKPGSCGESNSVVAQIRKLFDEYYCTLAYVSANDAGHFVAPFSVYISTLDKWSSCNICKTYIYFEKLVKLQKCTSKWDIFVMALTNDLLQKTSGPKSNISYTFMNHMR